jgi:hypothetical protein
MEHWRFIDNCKNAFKLFTNFVQHISDSFAQTFKVRKKNFMLIFIAFILGDDPDPGKNDSKRTATFHKRFWSNVCDVLRQPTESVFFQMIQTIKRAFRL